MSKTIITHQVKAGERWDTLAYRYYGDALEMSRLLEANPHLALGEQLPQGETVLVPVVDADVARQDELPPWLKGGEQ